MATLSTRGLLEPSRASAACSDTVLVRAAKTFTKPGSNDVTFYEPCTLTAVPGRRFLIEALTPTSSPIWTARIAYGGVEYFGTGDVASTNTLVSRVVTPMGAGYLKVTLTGPTGAQLIVRVTQVSEPLYKVYDPGSFYGGATYSSTKTYTKYFSFAEGIPTSPHSLLLTNGNPDTVGGLRTQNTEVWLNSQPVISYGEVTTGKAFLTRSVTLDDVNTLQVTIPQGNANKKVWVSISATDESASGITVVTPVDSAVTSAAKIPVTVQVDEPQSGTRLFLDGAEKPLSNATWSDSLLLPTAEGIARFVFSTLNGACLASAETLSVIRVTSGPWLSVVQPAAELTTTTGSSVTLAGGWASVASVLLTVNGDSLPSRTPTGTFSQVAPLALGANTFMIRARDALDSSTVVVRTVIREPLGAGASEPVAPPVASTQRPDFRLATKFLYGPGGVQIGPDTSDFAPERVAVIRGRVVQATGTADTIGLAHVRVEVVGHESQYGYTLSRASGNFDLVVNGGGPLTLQFTRSGFAPARRTVDVPWRDYVRLDDVALKGYDAKVVSVTLSDSASARGSTIEESGRVRTPTLLFKAGTTATGVDSSGVPQSLGSSITVRTTEFTVGPEGPRRMPAPLPSASAYTHCVDLTVTEAEALGLKEVRFSPPVAYYIENFLDLPVGTVVPVGSFDPDTGWVAEENGLVIAVLDTAGGAATIDLNNDGQPDTELSLDSLGIDSVELQQLAAHYRPGQTLWRSRVDHFSTWDWNLPFGWPDDAEAPDGGWPYWLQLLLDHCRECPGSVIEMENQTLREAIPLVGTPYELHYSSARVAGNRRPYRTRIPLYNKPLPTSVTGVHWSLDVAGRHYGGRFSRTDAPRYVDVEWSGLDVYDREVVGAMNAHIKVGYSYGAVYAITGGGRNGRSWGSPPRGGKLSSSIRGNEGIIWAEFDLSLGAMRNEAAGLGDWSLTPNHFYDFGGSGTLYRGDGIAEPGERLSPTITDVYRINEYEIFDVKYASDGALYFAQANGTVQSEIYRLLPGATAPTKVAGASNGDMNSENIPALNAKFSYGVTLALGPDGSIYLAEPGNHRVRKIDLNGNVRTIAGSMSTADTTGDGGPASNARFRMPSALAVATDGSIYVVDRDAYTIRRIAPDGTISRFAGTGSTSGVTDAEVQANRSPIFPMDGRINVGPTGDVVFADMGMNRVRQVTADGVMRLIGIFDHPSDVQYSPECVLHVLTGNPQATARTQVFRVDASQTPSAVPVVGLGTGPVSMGVVDPPRPALSVPLRAGCSMSFDGDGRLAIGMYDIPSSGHICAVRPVFPGFSLSEYVVVSRDGSEKYVFDVSGRHLRTLDALTGGTRYVFNYAAYGGEAVRLRSIYDMNGDSTIVGRNAQGDPTQIAAPDGQVTVLQLASGRLAAVTNPTGSETIEIFAQAASGLLDSLRDARGYSHHYLYELDGRLRSDLAADGYSTTLTNDPVADADIPDRVVRAESALGRQSTHAVDFRDLRQTEIRTATGPDALADTTTRSADESVRVFAPEGTSLTYVPDPDPRFGMQAPIPKQVTIDWPGSTPNSIVTTTRVMNEPTGTLTTTTTVNGTRVYKSEYTVQAGVRTLTLKPPSTTRNMAVTMDTVGRPLTVSTPGPLADIVNHYDGRGRLDFVTVGTRRWDYYYEDARGRLTRVRDPLDRETRFAYDEADRVRWQVLPATAGVPDTVFFEHDAGGNLTGLRPPGKPPLQWHRFALTPGELTWLYDPPDVPGLPVDTTHYEFDADRALTAIARPDGQAVGLSYDGAGRLERVTQPRGEAELHYHSSGPGKGRAQSITSPDGVRLDFAYDGPMPTGETWTFADASTGGVEHSYDANLWTGTQTVSGTSGPASTVIFTHDDDGLLEHAAITGGQTLVLSPATQTGLLEGTTVGGLATRYAYNPYAELTSTAAWFGADTVLSAQYDRDGVGRIARIVETLPAGTTDRGYYYDDRDRLICVRDSIAHVDLARYGYDGNGNRVGYLTATDSVTAAYDEQDRLVDRGATHYTYTPNGERTARTDASGTLGTSYDLLGNLTVVGLPGADTVRYEIDGRNRRVGRSFNGTTTARWLYANDLNVVGELDEAGVLRKRFVYASRGNVPDLMVVRNGSDPDSIYGIVTDQLGSVRAVVNVSTGFVAQRLTYDAWGVVTEDTNPAFTPFAFAGGLYDPATGLVRFGARDYDPQAGVWTCKDPIGLEGGSANLTAYAADDPLNLIDPGGHAVILFDRGAGLITVDPENGGARYTIPATSGAGIGLNRPEYERGRGGPIPAGSYFVRPSEISNPGWLADELRNRIRGDWGDWRVRIHRTAKTKTFGRSGFFLHGGRRPGSGGCIDIGGEIHGSITTGRILQDLLRDPDDYVPVIVR